MAIDINIGSKLDGKGFKQADTAITKLNKNTKNLARNFGLAFGTAAVLAYSRAAVKAFAEDEKAAMALGTTLKNLGLAYGSNIGTVNGFISRLEIQTGVLDDELRPAMDRLLRATGDVTKSQELLGLALDIAAGTGKSVTQVSQSLQKAYLGQKQALGRLGVGLTKAELETSSFEQIQARLAVLFAGQASAAADTYAGSLSKLTVASNNAKETIGKGLVDALMTATNSQSTDEFIAKIDKAAQSIANFVRETGEFIRITKSIFDFKNFSFFAPSGGLFGDGKGFGNISMTVSSQDTQRADVIARKNAMAMTKLTKEQAAAQAKIVKDKKLAAAIDKANLALNKGNEVFDMDKIQIAAALTNQAEQLGRATSSAQVLQIANDTARLNVKRSILALEDAIAAKDEAAIIAATKKLNADLGVLNALTGQNTQMKAIESILAGLKPKELIDQANLDEALRKIKEMLDMLAKMNSKSGGNDDGGDGGDRGGTSDETNKILKRGRFVPIVPDSGGTTKGGSSSAGAYAASGFPGAAAAIAADAKAAANAAAKVAAAAAAEEINRLLESGSFVGITPGRGGSMGGSSSAGAYAAWGFPGAGGSGSSNVNITVNTGVGDPNAIAEAIDQVLTDAAQRGTLRGYTLA